MTPASRAGERYPLLLHTRMLDRWWPALLLIGLGMLELAWPFYTEESTRLTEPWRWMTMAGVGILITGAALLMFWLRSLRGLKRDILEPLFSHRAVVIDMNALPVPSLTLKPFVSPFFFKDRTPHIVILVRDRMGFSTELESTRSGKAGREPARKQSPTSILTELPQKK